MLQFTVLSLIGKKQTYRANIVLLDPVDNNLKIAARYNMDPKLDRCLPSSSDKDGSGKALQNNCIEIFDLRDQNHSDLGVKPSHKRYNLIRIF